MALREIFQRLRRTGMVSMFNLKLSEKRKILVKTFENGASTTDLPMNLPDGLRYVREGDDIHLNMSPAGHIVAVGGRYKAGVSAASFIIWQDYVIFINRSMLDSDIPPFTVERVANLRARLPQLRRSIQEANE